MGLPSINAGVQINPFDDSKSGGLEQQKGKIICLKLDPGTLVVWWDVNEEKCFIEVVTESDNSNNSGLKIFALGLLVMINDEYYLLHARLKNTEDTTIANVRTDPNGKLTLIPVTLTEEQINQLQDSGLQLSDLEAYIDRGQRIECKPDEISICKIQ